MALPRILIAVPLIVAGAFLPAVDKVTVTALPGTVGMVHEGFSISSIQIHRGDTLTFINNSGYMHIIGPGKDGVLAETAGDPVRGRALVETNGKYTSPPFEVVGTFYITCSMHPEMTVKVVVTN